jgi:hypothetical protein
MLSLSIQFNIKESCRFVDQAMHIMRSIAEAIKYFSDPEKQKPMLDLLNTSISPLTDAYLNERGPDGVKKLSKKNLIEVGVYLLAKILRQSLKFVFNLKKTQDFSICLIRDGSKSYG